MNMDMIITIIKRLHLFSFKHFCDKVIVNCPVRRV